MPAQEIENLEKLVCYMAYHYVRKAEWQDVTKSEWLSITDTLNENLSRATSGKKIQDSSTIGENYIYEHIIIKKLKPWRLTGQLQAVPHWNKLNLIASALGFEGYIDFINNAATENHFNEIRIDLPHAGGMNTALLDNLVGHWYSYNRNLAFEKGRNADTRIWRSAMEIFRVNDEYCIERTGMDSHKYYGKVTAYGNYLFILMNSTTFIRQRHFIAHLKTEVSKLRQPTYRVSRINLISTCVSFNEEPIALHEIFERVTDLKKFVKASIDFDLDSSEIPPYVLQHLSSVEKTRLR